MTIARRWQSVVKIAAVLSIGLSGAAAMVVATSGAISATAASATTRNVDGLYSGASAHGELDCNGFSPAQKPLRAFACTDIRGLAGVSNQNTWGNRFYDNGHYIGHDEPDATFLSNRPGSGDNVSWGITLGKDPTAAPTDANPGEDVSHYFELTPAPWVSMAICDPNSYPQTSCTPNSDSNAPSGRYLGGGSSFMEMQFYPPGNAPWIDSESCDGTHWCAALTIDSLECTEGFAQCNLNCEEPVNFAFIQTDGVPAGPPSPQLSDIASSLPNADTLLMNPGDKVTTQISDAPVPGEAGQHAFKVTIHDLTRGTSGSMQASAKNGFQNTSIVDCSGTPFNFEPEYSTAAAGNVIPWAALQTNISTEFETGHYEPCTSLSDPFASNPIDPSDKGGVYNGCSGPYETAGGDEGAETGDALCYEAGDVHTGYDGNPSDTTAPDEATGCQDNWYQNGDLDFDGTPYYKEWPTSVSPTSKYPGSFVESLPLTNGKGYSRFFFQTDVALSETSCSSTKLTGCTVPPVGPGKFYPYWSEADQRGTCTLEFGNVSSGVDDFGKDAQYGTVQYAKLGYPEFESKILDNTCPALPSEGYLLAGKSGQVVSAGDAPSLPAVHAPPASVVGIASTPDGQGYFAVTNTGAVFTGGDAAFQGDLTTRSPSTKVSDIVAIVATADGDGYWLVGANGAVSAFGDAKLHGSLAARHTKVNDVVGMAATTSGAGYVLVGADGSVFAFGSAHYHGSLPGKGIHVDDIRSIVLSAKGTGYILFGANGAAFVFGTGAPFHGSLPAKGVKVSDIVGVALTADGGGYWMAGSNGTVYPFGDARALASTSKPSDLPVTGIATADVDLP
jgi:hypothetical protein